MGIKGHLHIPPKETELDPKESQEEPPLTELTIHQNGSFTCSFLVFQTMPRYAE